VVSYRGTKGDYKPARGSEDRSKPFGSPVDLVREPGYLSNHNKELHIDLNVPPSSLAFEQGLALFDYSKQAGSGKALQIIAGSENRLRKQQEGIEKMHRTRTARKR
jgi:hypothetical protein